MNLKISHVTPVFQQTNELKLMPISGQYFSEMVFASIHLPRVRLEPIYPNDAYMMAVANLEKGINIVLSEYPRVTSKISSKNLAVTDVLMVSTFRNGRTWASSGTQHQISGVLKK